MHDDMMRHEYSQGPYLAVIYELPGGYRDLHRYYRDPVCGGLVQRGKTISGDDFDRLEFLAKQYAKTGSTVIRFKYELA